MAIDPPWRDSPLQNIVNVNWGGGGGISHATYYRYTRTGWVLAAEYPAPGLTPLAVVFSGFNYAALGYDHDGVAALAVSDPPFGSSIPLGSSASFSNVYVRVGPTFPHGSFPTGEQAAEAAGVYYLAPYRV